MLSPEKLERIVRNHVHYRKDGSKAQYQDPSPDKRVWAKITPKQVAELLDQVGSGPDSPYRSARALLDSMSLDKWTILATAHTGGASATAPLHITLQVPQFNRPAYHLDVREIAGKGLHIYRISQESVSR